MQTPDTLSYQHIASELRIFHGGDSLLSLKRELDRAGCRRALVVCGRTVSQSAALVSLRAALGPSLAEVAPTVRENSPISAVEETARFAQDARADALIAVGGGSAAVTARAAAVFLGEGKPLADLCTRRLPDGKFESPRLHAPKLPIFVVPTTPSTAFAKAGSAVHDASGQRMAMFDPKTRARAVFVHPEFVRTAPAKLVLDAALNAFANAIEALESPRCDPISEALLMQALRLLRVHLPNLALDQGTLVREYLVVAGLLCGRGTEQGGAGLASVLAHAIGHRSHVANGIVNAIVLPHTIAHNAPATLQRWGCILEGLAVQGESDAGAAVAGFLAGIGAPRTLRDIAVPEADLQDIAQAAMQDWFIGRAPQPIRNEQTLVDLLRRAW